MDRRRDRGDLVLSAGAALALCATLALVFSDLSPHRRGAGEGTPAIGKVEGRSGEVRRRTEGTLVWGALDQGDPLYEGDAVWVAEDGAASLSLGRSGRLEVAPASLVVLHSPGHEALELLEGGAVGRSGDAGLSIRAGAGAVTLDPGGSAADVAVGESGPRVDVLEGQGRLAGRSGEARVAAGERARLDKAGNVDRSRLEVELLSPARGERLFAGAEKVPVVFRWKAPGGAPMTLEIAHDARFKNLVGGGASPKGALSQELSPGAYRWRLRSGSVSSEERTLVVVPDHPPVAYRPRNDQELVLPAEGPLLLEWTPAPSAGGYRVELAFGEEFSGAERIETDRTFLVDHKARENGRWCWRVTPTREGAASSKPSCFLVTDHARLRAPVLYDPKVSAPAGGGRGRR